MAEAALSFVAVPGIRLGGAAAGIRYQGRDDLLVIEMDEGGTAAAVFTTNAFCAAPVQVARAHLASSAPRLLLINSGNANAGTGQQGMSDARRSCAALAALAGTEPDRVLPFSTGVIGEYLPMDRLEAALPKALSALSEDAWPAAAAAIMTTDTVPKLASRTFVVGGREARLTGIAKGSGMIRPDMATMLSYLATDAAVATDVLASALQRAVAGSFNSISVDGDTSTNDACVLLASGALGNAPIRDTSGEDYAALSTALDDLCLELATAIVRDGEGATKLVTISVSGARDGIEARRVADTVAHSPLVKTALFASDPNWGRILAAVGRSGVVELDIDKIRIHLGDLLIVSDGGRASGYSEAAGQAVMGEPEIHIGVDLGRGDASARVLTCDLSYDYVKINAEYRS